MFLTVFCKVAVRERAYNPSIVNNVIDIFSYSQRGISERKFLFDEVVRKGGLEPPRPKSPDPKSGAATITPLAPRSAGLGRK